jgi:hypothetical protein
VPHAYYDIIHHQKVPALLFLERFCTPQLRELYIQRGVHTEQNNYSTVFQPSIISFFASAARTLQKCVLHECSFDLFGPTPPTSRTATGAVPVATIPVSMPSMPRMEVLTEFSLTDWTFYDVNSVALFLSSSCVALRSLTIRTLWHQNISNSATNNNANGIGDNKSSSSSAAAVLPLLHQIYDKLPVTINELHVEELDKEWNEADIPLLVAMFQRLHQLRNVDFGEQISEPIYQGIVTAVKSVATTAVATNNGNNGNESGHDNIYGHLKDIGIHSCHSSNDNSDSDSDSE